MTEQYNNYSDDMLVDDILNLEGQKASLDIQIKQAKNTLVSRKADEIAAALKAKKEPFGDVSQEINDYKVKFNTPKKVEWAQTGLEELWAQMLADGANPNEYIKIKYEVSEDAYKNWPSNLKEYFAPFRTVTPGNIAVKIEPVKEK